MKILVNNQVFLGDQSKVLEAGKEYIINDDLAKKLIKEGMVSAIKKTKNETNKDK
tara:strand:+ start:1196 stop:1360 length:165 start_codon:yes stop_codon:yes gene_type:complete